MPTYSGPAGWIKESSTSIGPRPASLSVAIGTIDADDINLDDDEPMDWGTGGDVGAKFDPNIGTSGAWVLEDNINTNTFTEAHVGDALVYPDLPTRYEDNVEQRFGTGDDISKTFDPTVGASGAVVVRDEINNEDIAEYEVNGNVNFLNRDVHLDNGQFLTGGDAGGADTQIAGITGGDIVLFGDVSGNGLTTDIQADGTTVLSLQTTGNANVDNGDLNINADGNKVTWGAGQDASARYDGTDLLIDPQEVGSGDVALEAGNLDLDRFPSYIDVGRFADGSEPAANPGRTFYSDEDEVLSFFDQNDIEVNIGLDIHRRVKNVSGSTINAGEVVKVTGASGTNPEVQLAQADTLANSESLAVMRKDLNNNSVGKAIITGRIEGVDTSSFSAGDQLYLDPDNAGQLQNTQPTYSDVAMRIGTVVNSDAANGVISINIDREPDIFTQGSILFADSEGRPAEDNDQLFWDDTSEELGIGTSSPGAALDVASGDVHVSTDGAAVVYGAGQDVGSRFDSGEDELKWRDVGTADRMSLARTSGDLVIDGTLDETASP